MTHETDGADWGALGTVLCRLSALPRATPEDDLTWAWAPSKVSQASGDRSRGQGRGGREVTFLGPPPNRHLSGRLGRHCPAFRMEGRVASDGSARSPHTLRALVAWGTTGSLRQRSEGLSDGVA